MNTLQRICALLILFSISSAQAEEGAGVLELPKLLGKWIPVDARRHDDAARPHSIQWVEFLQDNNIQWSVKIGPTSKPQVRRGTYRLLQAGNFVHHSTKRITLQVNPTLFDPAVGGVREDGTPIFLMDVRVGEGIDNRFPLAMELLKFRGQSVEFVFTRKESEQTPAGDVLKAAPEE